MSLSILFEPVCAPRQAGRCGAAGSGSGSRSWPTACAPRGVRAIKGQARRWRSGVPACPSAGAAWTHGLQGLNAAAHKRASPLSAQARPERPAAVLLPLRRAPSPSPMAGCARLRVRGAAALQAFKSTSCKGAANVAGRAQDKAPPVEAPPPGHRQSAAGVKTANNSDRCRRRPRGSGARILVLAPG